MAYSSIRDVQTALNTVMVGDAGLMTKLTGVFDEAPTDQPFSYISFGSKTEIPWGNQTFGNAEKDVAIMLDIWTALTNGDAHLNILEDLGRLFDNPIGGIPLSAYRSVKCFIEMTTTLIDEVDSVRHTVCRIRTVNT